MATLVSPSISLRPSLTPRIARGRAAAAVRAASGDDANLDTVYVGKGKFVKDDARKYPSRDALTGGWAGGEVGMWAFRDKEQKGNAAQSMRPARDVASAVGLSNGGSTPAVSSEPNDDASSSASSRGDRDAASASTSNVDKIKYELMKTLATLDRGVAASEDDRSAVNALVESLETLASSPSRAASLAPTEARLAAALDGAWRLAYSSTFAGEQTGSQGFTGAPGGGSPGASLGSVYQRLSFDDDEEKATCDNVVELRGPFGGAAAASLGHSCAVTGNTCRITFTGVTVERNPFGLPPFTLPSPMDALPREARDALMSGGFQSGAFDTTFVDAETRVSRGDRGELRVFVKEA